RDGRPRTPDSVRVEVAVLIWAGKKGGVMLQEKRIAICASVFALVFCGILAYAQNTAGTILGTTSDQSGARLPGVMVTITHVETGIVRSATTDDQGRYRAPGLGLGNYEVKAELPGFRAEVRKGIQLTVAAEVVVNLSLR